MTVTEMPPAASPAEWILPARARDWVFAFGPQGLDEKKVTNLVTKDKRLISQMSQYADQTSQTEDNLELLSLIGLPVDAMPTTSAASGSQQTLKIAMPWPSPTGHLQSMFGFEANRKVA